MEATSLLVFLLMLILMAKGYTITRGRLSTSGSIKIAVFMTLYSITYAVLFIYEAQVKDHGIVKIFRDVLNLSALSLNDCKCNYS